MKKMIFVSLMMGVIQNMHGVVTTLINQAKDAQVIENKNKLSNAVMAPTWSYYAIDSGTFFAKDGVPLLKLETPIAYGDRKDFTLTVAPSKVELYVNGNKATASLDNYADADVIQLTVSIKPIGGFSFGAPMQRGPVIDVVALKKAVVMMRGPLLPNQSDEEHEAAAGEHAAMPGRAGGQAGNFTILPSKQS